MRIYDNDKDITVTQPHSDAAKSNVSENGKVPSSVETIKYLEQELMNARSETRALKTSLGLASKDCQQWKSKSKKRETYLLIALIPWLVLLFPISLPVGIIYGVVSFSKRKKRKIIRENRGVIIEAHNISHSENIDAVKEFLELKKHVVVPEALPLFESVSALTDADWKTHFNDFLTVRKEANIKLVAGSAPRFHRIIFDAQNKINDGPKVSVIMPSFNCEDTISLAVHSILGQSWQNIELIVVDDCSTDGTWSTLEELAKSDPRMKIMRQSVNAGPYVAKNRGLLNATGSYVTGHDSDDIAIPNRIERQIAPMLEDKSKKASLGYMIRLDPNARFSHASRIGYFSNDGIARLASISLLINKTVLDEQLGFWDTARFGADSEMISRVRDLLGDNLVVQDTLTMLCLDADGNLTNNPKTGIRFASGLSPIREDYRDAWRDWHKATPSDQRYVPFPHHGDQRVFDLPPQMRVSDEAVAAVLEIIKEDY